MTQQISGRIAILGTGLIGGSLGLSWKERRTDWTIVGHDRPDVLDRAHERGAIDEKAADAHTAVRNADVVVLATPLGTTLRLLESIADQLQEGVVVTDVASVKTPVMAQAADVLPDHAHVLGGHPMAGAETSGIDAADALLFENAYYALCLPEAVSEDALSSPPLSTVVDLIETTGARTIHLGTSRHDRIAAWVSHLPQVLSVMMVNLLEDLDDEVAHQLAAGGFRDMTRIASSPFSMWRDILVGNQRHILDALGALSRSVQRLRNRLIEDDIDQLEDAFEQAAGLRATIPTNQKGMLHPLFDVMVRARDRPGELHTITGALLDADLNVRDIELLKFREGTGGTFRLSFEDHGDAEEAVKTLEASDFRARMLE